MVREMKAAQGSVDGHFYGKYRLLFSPKRREKPGPKGPDADLAETLSWALPNTNRHEHELATLIVPSFGGRGRFFGRT